MPRCAPLAPSLSAYAGAWTNFAATIEAVIAQLTPMSPTLSWPVVGASGRHLGDVTAADFCFKLANVHWTLVDASFAGVNGGVGMVQSYYNDGHYWMPKDWLRAEEEINAADFQRYMNLAGGMDYLILHETAHVTALGLQTNNMQWDTFRQQPGHPIDAVTWAKSPEWLRNEQVANAIANTVAQALGLLILDHPTCGFPDDPATPAVLRTAAGVP